MTIKNTLLPKNQTDTGTYKETNRGRDKYSQTCLTQPHSVCGCPKPGTYNPDDVIVLMLKCYLFNVIYFNGQ